jgi:GntR family transcriptional regulator
MHSPRDPLPKHSILSDHLPLWYQVEQNLRSEILTRQFAKTGRLPTEVELAKHYGVSLITVRGALRSLEEDGMIVRRRRFGTFVRPEVYDHHELKVLGTIETVVAQQASEETELLERKKIALPEEYRHLFGSVDEVFFFRRLRSKDGMPVSYVLNYVILEYGSHIRASHLKRSSMTQALRNHAGAKIARMQDIVEARLASPKIAQLLEVHILSPVLYQIAHVYDKSNRLIDLACIYYRGDRYKFSVDIRFGVNQQFAVGTRRERQ